MRIPWKPKRYIELFASIEQMASAMGVPVATLRKWIKSELISEIHLGYLDGLLLNKKAKQVSISKKPKIVKKTRSKLTEEEKEKIILLLRQNKDKEYILDFFKIKPIMLHNFLYKKYDTSDLSKVRKELNKNRVIG